MNTLLRIVLTLVLILFMLSLVSCAGNCVTGKVLNKTESGGNYYLHLAITRYGVVFTGEEKTIEVDRDFYFFSGVNHVVTVCN